jgi:glycosyltransferase involved in cell wall biosynthesis
MNIHLENVNLNSTSGPNHFAVKLIKYINATFNPKEIPDVRLCFIETHNESDIPLVQRLDGIYFNTSQNYKLQNSNILRTYNRASGVIYQSNFNKELTIKYFGPHKNSTVIHNGADIDFINKILPLNNSKLDKYDNVWACASSWRPHKRLAENIRYFLEHSAEKDCLVIAGKKNEKIIKHDRIFYVGDISIPNLISLYKRSKYFIHLAWLDHCPNVVVDARASGCKVICSSTGGTKEIAGPDATLIQEEEWDYSPVELYNPPILNFNKKLKNHWKTDYNMRNVAIKYQKFLEGI